jgi:outer membrane protein assembly factor BamD (BamD/ComL family)
MSVTGVSSSSFYSGINSSNVQSKFQQIRQEFKQLGQDLQSGNLTQAQSDFATLQQNLPNQQQTSTGTTTSTPQSTNPLTQAVAQLGQDLQAGNLTAAQSDYATIQQDVQQQQGSGQVQHHHHHHHGGGQGADSNQQNNVASLFNQLGQELQSGNVTQAQQTYASLQQDFQQFSAGNGFGASSSGSSSSGSPSSTGGFSVTV